MVTGVIYLQSCFTVGVLPGLPSIWAFWDTLIFIPPFDSPGIPEMRVLFLTSSCLLAGQCIPTSTACLFSLPSSRLSQAPQGVSDAICVGATGRWGNSWRREIPADVAELSSGMALGSTGAGGIPKHRSPMSVEPRQGRSNPGGSWGRCSVAGKARGCWGWSDRDSGDSDLYSKAGTRWATGEPGGWGWLPCKPKASGL